MRCRLILLSLLTLAGCNKEAADPTHRPGGGRYLGIGTYSAGELWSHVKLAAPKEEDAATTADDEHVVVVVDSFTGELRQCGDMSGACIAMNPWRRAGPEAAQPVRLDIHAAALAVQREAEQAEPVPETK